MGNLTFGEIREAAEQGYVEPQYYLGFCYHNGREVPQDFKQAAYWYRKAAEQGFAEAQYCLGLCYDNGEGVPQNSAEAVFWWHKAAEQGYADAQNNLGSCYENGEGVHQNFDQAFYWYSKAAEQGNAAAQQNLNRKTTITTVNRNGEIINTQNGPSLFGLEEKFLENLKKGNNYPTQGKIVFNSSSHLRFENGISLKSSPGAFIRTIVVEPNINGGEGYSVSILESVAPKQMKIVSVSDEKIVLRGFGFDRTGAAALPLENYGFSILLKNGIVDKVIMHMYDKESLDKNLNLIKINVDIEYYQ